MHSLLFLQRITRTSLVPSSTLICTCLLSPRKFLTAPTSFTIWSGQPSFRTNLSESHTAEWIIFAMTGISVCSPLFETFFATVVLDGPLFETPFATVMLDGFLLSIKGLSSTNRLPFPSFFLDLVWQTMLPSPTALFQQEMMVLCMRVVPLASSLLSKSMKHSSHGSRNRAKNANTGNHTLISWTILIGFFF